MKDAGKRPPSPMRSPARQRTAPPSPGVQRGPSASSSQDEGFGKLKPGLFSKDQTDSDKVSLPLYLVSSGRSSPALPLAQHTLAALSFAKCSSYLLPLMRAAGSRAPSLFMWAAVMCRCMSCAAL